jgi:hypothetical protein
MGHTLAVPSNSSVLLSIPLSPQDGELPPPRPCQGSIRKARETFAENIRPARYLLSAILDPYQDDIKHQLSMCCLFEARALPGPRPLNS